ncbi:MAG: hypothetical protein VKP72_11365 [bacterium]|nr:hypothetical protein [bacterium]
MPDRLARSWTCFALGLLVAFTGRAQSPVLAAPDVTAATLENMTRENRRSHQLQLHQSMALTTLGLMAAEATLGLASSRDLVPGSWARPLHIALGGGTAAMYGVTAWMAYSTEPAEGETQDTIVWHRWLSYAHLVTMLATVGLGYATSLPSSSLPSGWTRDSVQSWHGAMGGTSIALMTASLGVLIFEF